MRKILRRLTAREWLGAGISLVLIVAQVWLDLKLPDFMAEITRLTQTPGSAMADIWRAGGKMLLCALGSLTSAVIVGYFAARIAASFSRSLRSQLFQKVDSFSMEEINRFSTASLITRSTNDVTQVQMLIIMGLQVTIKAPIMAVWAVSKIAGKGTEWTMATGVVLLVMMSVIGLVMWKVFPKFRQMQVLTDNINRVTRENLTGLSDIRAYNGEAFQQARFEAANEELTRTQLYTSRGMAVMMPVVFTMMSVLSLVIYWIGATLINQANKLARLGLFSNMVVFSSYAMQVIMTFMMIVMVFIMTPRASAAARRINEVLDTKPSIREGTQQEGLPGLRGEVEFRGVGFKYPDASEYVLQDVSFKARQGETVAFIGSTGSGKSTLINLVPRFYDASEGEVLVNGVNVKEYSLDALHRKIGYVPQQAVMFQGTVTSNVNFSERSGEELTDAVKRAVAIAQAQDFVEEKEGQYEAQVAQGGTNFSGGQRQRLSIARAVCRDPEIYIFDDSFSALDFRTDRLLRSALKRETAGVTSLIVAQRIGTIMDSDRIIVLDEGRVVGQGTHRELMRSCRVYQEIALSQLGEEELAS